MTHFSAWLRRRVQHGPTLIAILFIPLLLAAHRPASAQLAKVETPDVCLVYVPDESFVVPHAARTFLNSLAFQKRLFDFTPTERITVLLTDFEDGGGATASTVPRDNLAVSLAPVSAPFETVTSNDRMNLIMNHELVHIVTMDQAARSDRLYRRLFSGKVLPIPAQPESILYFFLTTPRVAAPRWFHEGIATFLDTWMAGGVGRAQSGYDEMVFRSMVKDGAASTIGSASCRKAPKSTSCCRPTRICTGRGSWCGWLAHSDRRSWSSGSPATKAAVPTTRPNSSVSSACR